MLWVVFNLPKQYYMDMMNIIHLQMTLRENIYHYANIIVLLRVYTNSVLGIVLARK